MVAETVLKNLGLRYAGVYAEDGSFVVDLDTDVDFGRVYTTLDNSADLDYQEENSLLTTDNANLNYLYQDAFLITLSADFEQNTYKLTLTEIE